MEEITPIGKQNATRLGILSTIFCLTNGIEMNDELVTVLSLTITAHLNKWYDDHGRELNPNTDLIEEEAVAYAFERVQEVANAAAALSAISAQTGIGFEE